MSGTGRTGFNDLSALERDVIWALIAAGGDRNREARGATQGKIIDRMKKLGYEEPPNRALITALQSLREAGWVTPSEKVGYVLTHKGWERTNAHLRGLERAVSKLNPDDEGETWVLEFKKVRKSVQGATPDD